MHEKELIDRSLFFLIHNFDEYTKKQHAIAELRSLLIEHNRLYYQEAAPCISDVEYDQLFLLLKQWEEEYPELTTQDSPTQALLGQKLE
jgi:DNA ligase (NAD+)